MYEDHHIRMTLRPYVGANETLRWTGRPQQGIVFSPSDLFVIPFGLFWTAFSITWVVLAFQASVLFSLFGIPFVIVGLNMLVGRFWTDQKNRANSYYGLTEQHLIIISGAFKPQAHVLDLRHLPPMEVEEINAEIGTISIGQRGSASASLGRGTSWSSDNSVSLALERIGEVRKVYALIMEYKKAALQS